MHIAIDATSAVTGGGVTYLLNLLPALGEADQHNQYTVFLPAGQALARLRLPANFRLVHCRFPKPTAIWRIVWEQTLLPIQLVQKQVNVMYGPADIIPVMAPCPAVVAVRNLWPHAPLTEPATRATRFRHAALSWLTQASCHKARRILFPSYVAAEELGGKIGVPVSKRAIVPHGVADSFRQPTSSDEVIRQHYGLTMMHYVLFVSALYPHKNVETLIEAFGHWLRVSNNTQLQLVIAGRAVDEAYFGKLEEMVHRLALQGNVQFLGEVPYNDMSVLYRGARAFIFPSLLESFGHPLAEAMAAGTPVIASDIPAAHEVCGDAALYFPLRDSAALADRLAQLLHKPSTLGDELVNRGRERASQLTWENAAKTTLAVIKAAAG